MQGGEDEVARLGGGQRGRDRLEVAHLADEDHVGVLAQRGAQRLGEAGRVGPISRWVTTQRLCRCTNSIGSSIVRMCCGFVRLISSTIAASVVDFPEPVGPVTRTRPRGFIASSRNESGSPQLLERSQLRGNVTEGRAEGAALEVDVDAEATEPGTPWEKSSWRWISSCFCCSVERMR